MFIKLGSERESKNAFRAANHPFVEELIKNEKKSLEDWKKRLKEKDAQKETIKDEDQHLQDGDKVWFGGKKGTYTTKRTKKGVKHFVTVDGQTHELTAEELNAVEKRTKVSEIKASLRNTKN